MHNVHDQFVRVDKVIIRILKIISFISAAAMLVVAVLASVDVVMAKVFRVGLPNATEIIKYLLVPIVYSACAFLAVDQGLINVDLVQNKFPRTIKRAINVFGDILGAMSSAFLAWCGYSRFMTLLQSGEKSSTSAGAFKLWPFALIFFVGMALLAFALLWRMVREFIAPELNLPKPLADELSDNAEGGSE